MYNCVYFQQLQILGKTRESPPAGSPPWVEHQQRHPILETSGDRPWRWPGNPRLAWGSGGGSEAWAIGGAHGYPLRRHDVSEFWHPIRKDPKSFLFGGPENTHSNDYIYIYIYITKEALAEAAAFAQSNSSLQPTHPRRPKHQCQRATFRGGLGPRTLDSRDIWSIGFIIPGHMQNIQILFSMVLY